MSSESRPLRSRGPRAADRWHVLVVHPASTITRLLAQHHASLEGGTTGGTFGPDYRWSVRKTLWVEVGVLEVGAVWRGESTAVVVVAGLGASALLLAFAPRAMPAGYSWLAHTTSESAAQGVNGAWLARLGFVLFGLSVLLLILVRRRVWGPAAVLHGAFGLFMVAVGVFSARSWVPDAAFDRTEDLMHSVAASAMGFAFALGVVVTLLRERPAVRQRRWPLDVTALVASVVVPLAMYVLPELTGALQRVMFLVAYVWYAAEAVRGGRGGPVARGLRRGTSGRYRFAGIPRPAGGAARKDRRAGVPAAGGVRLPGRSAATGCSVAVAVAVGVDL